MLTTVAYRLLSRKGLPDYIRRGLMAMLTEYDLRNFVVIDIYKLTEHYGFAEVEEIKETLQYFVNAGVLELGPRVNFKQTYRIRSQFIVSVADVNRYGLQERQEREALALP